MSKQLPGTGDERPVTWLAIALGGAFTILMLFLPFQFQGGHYRLLYPVLRPLGALFGLAVVLMALHAGGVGLPTWMGRLGRWLLGAGLIAWVMTQALLTRRLEPGMITYGLLLAAVVVAGVRPMLEGTVFRLLYASELVFLGGFLVFVRLTHAGAYPHIGLWVDALFLAGGTAQIVWLTFRRRGRWLAIITMALPVLPLGWYTLYWFRSSNWTGVLLAGTFAVAAPVYALYLRTPWSFTMPGLRRRILAMTLTLVAVPTLALGAFAVYSLESTGREQALTNLRAAANRIERDMARRSTTALTPDDVQRLTSLEELTLQVLSPEQIPPHWDLHHGAGYLEEITERGQRRMVGYYKRPDLLIALSQPATLAYASARGAAAGILAGTGLLIGVASALSLFLSNRITRQISDLKTVVQAIGEQHYEVRAQPGNADDEVVILANAINEMAATLEAYREELVSQNEQLQAQSEEITAQNEELLAQSEAMSNQNRLLQAQALDLQEVRNELQTSLALVDTLFDRAPVGFAFLDRDLRFVRVNQALADINGISVEAHTGQSMQAIVPSVSLLLEPMYRQVLLTGEPTNWELSGETPAAPGKTRYWLGGGFPVRLPGQQIIGVGSVVVDVTAQKQAEQELLQAERRVAKEREAARTRFLQVAAHELRNPMAGVKGVLSLMRRRIASGRSPGELTELMLLMEREVDRLSGLLNEMLEAFRLQEGKLGLNTRQINLPDVLLQALEPFRAGQFSQRFTLTTPDSVLVEGDFIRLEEVFRNLLTNATKYSPPGSEIRLEVGVRANSVVVTVKDEGIGIPADQLERIFEGFYRATNLKGRDPGGMGLGLYICREIMQRHRGRIWAESSEGKGATFYVELPVNQSGEAENNNSEQV